MKQAKFHLDKTSCHSYQHKTNVIALLTMPWDSPRTKSDLSYNEFKMTSGELFGRAVLHVKG
jgi:hypothetical protein